MFDSLQVFHADIIPGKFLEHFFVEDSFLFLFEHPILELQLFLVLLH